MMMSLVQTNIFATDTDPDSTARGKVSMVYLGTGTGASADDLSIQTVPDTSTWTADPSTGTVFWVGITVSDLAKMDATAANDADRTSHFTTQANMGSYDWVSAGGIFNIAAGLEYASEYIKPVYVSDAQMKNNLFQPAVMKKLDPRYNNYSWQTANIAADIMAEKAGDGTSTGREPSVIKAEDNPKMVYVSVSTTGDITTNIFGFSDDLSNDPVYVMAVPFRLIKMPTAGTKVLQAALNPSNFVIQTGSSESLLWGAQWNSNRSVTPDKNLNNHLDYTGDLVLFPTSYTVTYMNDGTQVSQETVAENGNAANIPDSSTLTKPSDNKYFDGWYYDASGNNVENDATTKFDKNVAITADTTVYAKWKDPYEVKFHSNYNDDKTDGVNDETPESAYAAPDGTESVTVPSGVSNWSREGYGISGWVTADGTTFTPGTTLVTGNTDVYAVWTQNWKIEFVKVKGNSDAGNTVSTVYMDPNASDKTVDKPASDPTRAGYKFNGWYYDNPSGTKTAFVPKGEAGATEISGDTTIYADWIKQVTVRYYDTKANATTNDGSTGLLASETVDENTLYTDLKKRPATTDNDTTHKYFKGWTKTDGTTVVDFTDTTGKVTDDLVVYQDWGDYYKLEFYKEASDIGTTVYDTKYVNPNDGTTLSALPTNPDKSGYGFNEWRVYTGGAVTSTKFDTTTTVNGDMTLVADWTQQITITLYPNDGTGSDGLGTKVEKAILPNASLGSEYTAPTRTHYTLKEWNTQANGEGTSYPAALASQTFSASTTLYAIWEVASDVPDSDKVTLTFDSVGGSAVSPITVYKGDTIYAAQMPSDPTKTSATSNPYTFLGWYEAATLSNTNQITAPITMSADKTAYAHWDYTAADAITITFNDNGATTAVSPASIKIAPNDSIGAAWPTDPAKTDNTFGGWYTDTSDESTKKTSSSTFATNTTLNAKWIADITVNYDTNGGNNDGPGTVKKPAGDAYVDPTQTPTKNGVGTHPGYTFLGWNTEQNGSGTYIKAGNKTGSSDPLKYEDLVTGGASSVTLYAQWGALDNSTGTPIPAQEAVTVTFDGNGTTQKPVTKEANPKNKYPQLGDSIGATNMPNNPERTDYTFAGWNTKADGTGTTVTGTTVFDASLDGVTAVGDGTYTSTVYAQWTPTDSSTAITVKFNKNTDGTGNVADDVVTLSIVSGDSLGAAMPADPTNGTYAFDAWYAGSVTDGKVTTSGAALTSSTPISATTTYYAKWTKMLVARMQKNTAEYTGSQIKPLFDIYEVSYPDPQQPYVLGTKIATGIDPTTDSDYTITYTKDGVSATEVKDVGSYGFDVQLANTSALAIAGATIAVTDYEENNSRTSAFTVTPKLLTVKVDPDTQLQKAGANVPLADVTIDGIASTDAEANVIEKKYYKWTPADGSDTTIEQSELAVEATPTAIAKYVLQVTVKSTNKNYKIDSVVSSKDGTPVLLYEKTATSTYPAFNILSSDNNIVPGTNIVYVIQANDPSASISVKPGNKDTGLGSALSLYDTDYTTSVTFDDAEHPIRSDYYTRVSKDTDYVEFTVTPKNKTTVLTAPTAGTGITILGPDTATGAYTVKVDLTKSGATPNDITITTKAGNDTNAPTLDYNFHIQKLVEAKIVLNYGNSPVGMIMNDNTKYPTESAKTTAVDNFKSTHVFNDVTANLNYYTNAWTSYVGTGAGGTNYNGDEDPTAIFVYQRSNFRDVGFKAYDSLGNAVNDSNVSISLTMKSFKGGFVQYDSTDNPNDVVANVSGDKYLFTEFKNYDIRPDVYDMTYTFTDSYTNDTVTQIRKVVVISDRGDVVIDANNAVNNIDATNIISNNAYFMGNNVNSLYKFRIADTVTDANKAINNIDATEIISKVAQGLPQFYNRLQYN